MALQVPSVLRTTVNGTYLGAPVANIVDMMVPEGWGEMERPEACEAVAGNVLSAWSSEILPVMTTSYTATSVSYVDLSQQDGATGIVTSQFAETWPKSGAIGGEPYAASVATLVTKSTVAQRGQRSGRMFLPPPSEADMSGNTIGGPYLTALNAALSDFLDLVTAGTEEDGPAYPVVVHASGSFGTSSRVLSLSARARVSSQRRRNRA